MSIYLARFEKFSAITSLTKPSGPFSLTPLLGLHMYILVCFIRSHKSFKCSSLFHSVLLLFL